MVCFDFKYFGCLAAVFCISSCLDPVLEDCCEDSCAKYVTEKFDRDAVRFGRHVVLMDADWAMSSKLKVESFLRDKSLQEFMKKNNIRLQVCDVTYSGSQEVAWIKEVAKSEDISVPSLLVVEDNGLIYEDRYLDVDRFIVYWQKTCIEKHGEKNGVRADK